MEKFNIILMQVNHYIGNHNKWLTILLLYIPFISFGQAEFGIKGFVNSSSANITGFNPRFSGSGGIYLQENISKHFTLRQEALFSLIGYTTNENLPTIKSIDKLGDTIIIPGGNKKVAYNFNYIEIPLMLILKTGDKIKPYISAGGSFKIGVYSKKRISSEFIQGEQTFYNVNSTGFDATILAGAGIESKINKTAVHIEARYSKGLISQYNGIKFNNISLLLGIRI